jgi:hypothetical protein
VGEHAAGRSGPGLNATGVGMSPRRVGSSMAIAIGALSSAVGAADLYVQAGAVSGNGSRHSPFGTLQQAQQVSHDGDGIYVIASPGGSAIEGGIALKPHQKLLALDASGHRPHGDEPLAAIGNAADATAPIIHLSVGNEVSGFEFKDLRNPAILGSAEDYSGTYIHGNRFNGVLPSKDLVYAIELDAATGTRSNVRVIGNTVRDGDTLGGVRVIQNGDSSGSYLFQRNHFTDLGGRAYHIQTVEHAHVDSKILDSDADNIGLGNRNSDSILPYLMGQSSQNMLVRHYHYENTRQVGNPSNTGLEVFLYGWPRPESDRINWCTACRIKLEIRDSVFNDSVTDGIQLTNFGSNSRMEVVIRNSKILHSKPRQVGGSVSVVAEKEKNSGSRTTVLIENSDLSGSSQYGFAVEDQGVGHSGTFDLGGGALGSHGHNRIADCQAGAIKTQSDDVTAKNNWWGGPAPKVEVVSGQAAVELLPTLPKDPGP